MKVLTIYSRDDTPTSLESILHAAMPAVVLLTAHTGSLGLQLAITEDPDVIFLDSNPDSFHVCRQIKADARLKVIPVLFISDSPGDRTFRNQALEAGADGFLTSPLEVVDLTTQIRAMSKVKAANRLALQSENSGGSPQALQIAELEHQLAEARLLANQWQGTFDAVKDAVWILDSHLHIVRCNKAASRFLDLKGAADPEGPCWKLVHGRETPIPNCPLVRARQSQQRESLDLQVGENWYEVTVDPLLNKEGWMTGAIHMIADITLRKQAEEALRTSEMHFRTLVENIPQKIFVKDLEFRYVTVNQNLAQDFGLTPDQVKGKVDSDFFPEELAAKYRSDDRRVIRTGRTEELEEKYTRNGRETWVRTVKTPMRDNRGQVIGIVGIFWDISEHKLAESRLIESEKRYRALFENMTAGFVLFEVIQDDEGVPIDLLIVAANSGFERTTGLAGKDYLGKRLTEVVPGIEKDAANWIGKYGAVALSGEPLQFEQHSELLGYWYSINAYQAGPRQCAVTFSNITQRKQAEADRARLSQAIEQTDTVVIITATDATIQYVNPAFEAVTGYTRGEALGQKASLLNSGTHDDAFFRDLWETITGGKIWKGRLVNKRKDGTLYTEETTISPVTDISGHIVNFVAVKRDMTEHLRMSKEKADLEEQLRQSQKLESVGRLAGGVAHDFNNQLSIILGFGENVLDQLDKDDPVREEVEEIVRAGRRSAALTKQLLAFSRKQTLKPEVLNLNDVILTLEKMLRRLIGEHIELDLSLDPNISQVLLDPGQIEQVIMNLAINARDAMPRGGRLVIETATVELDRAYAERHSEITPGKHTLLAITDTGCGMDKETLGRAFDPFFTTKEKGQGTGLGLATVYGIVKQSGGNIWAYSEPGFGTTFKIYLPQGNTLCPPPDRGVEEPGFTRGGELILVVEDEESLRRLMKTLLSQQGYRVILAANSTEALGLIEEEGLKPDLIITDMIMPGLSGKQLIDHLKANDPNLTALFMSGYTDDTVLHHGVLDPDTPFLQKPFTLQSLISKVQEVLSHTQTPNSVGQGDAQA